MPKVTHNQTNFTAGELSPKLYGRVDIAKYVNGAARLENVIPLVQGGAISRNGTRYVCPSAFGDEETSASGSSSKSRLVPFVFNRSQSYVLEFCDRKIRFFRDNEIIMDGGAPYEVATPYTEEYLADLNFAQKSDTLIITHQSFEPYRLQRFGNNSWQLSLIPFVSVPVGESGYKPDFYARVETSPTPGELIVAGNVVDIYSYYIDTTEFDSGDFIVSDIGRYIDFGGGLVVVVTEITDPSNIKAKVVNAANAISGPQVYLPGRWTIQGSPRSSLKPSAAGPVGASIALTAGGAGSAGTSYGITGYAIADISIFPGGGFLTSSPQSGGRWFWDGTWLWAYVEVTHSAATFLTGQRVVIEGFTDLDGVDNINGVYTVKAVKSSTVLYISKRYLIGSKSGPSSYDDVAYRVGLIDSAGTAGSHGSMKKVTASGASFDTFRPDDVGGVVSINGGYARITEYNSPSKVTATVTKELSSDVVAIKDAWSLSLPVWNPSNGYPGAVTIATQRLIFAGSPTYPNSVWLSRIAEYYNFDLGTDDADAISITISSRDVVDIRHITENSGIVVLSTGGEHAIIGGVERPVTPTNIQVKAQSAFGCDNCPPIRVGAEILYPQRAGKRVRAMSYQYNTDSYSSPDISALADHMLVDGIKEMAYQQEPYSVLWIVTRAGGLVSCTIDREQNVIGWARHTSGNGVFESIASIPNGDTDDVWLVVKRTIANGTGIGDAETVDVRYIERFDPTLYHDCAGDDVFTSVPPVSYGEEAELLFARMTTPPSDRRKLAIDTCIKSLKSAGVWDKLDTLYMFFAADSQAACLDWRRGTKEGTLQGSASFTADTGITGSTVAGSRFDTAFNPSSDGVNYTRTNCAIGCLVTARATASASATLFGSKGATSHTIISLSETVSSGVLSGKIHGSGALTSSVISGGGLLSCSKSGNVKRLYKNSTEVALLNSSQSTTPTYEVSLFALNDNGSYSNLSDASVSMFFAGGYLTTDNLTALKLAVDTYVATGGNV